MKLNLFNEAADHTCRLAMRQPDDDNWARRNRNRCATCAAEYDAELDVGFYGDAPSPEEEAEMAPGEKPSDFLTKLLARDDPRRKHEGGRFGTGHVAGVDADDSMMVAAMKLWRDRNITVDPRTGIAKQRDVKDTCGIGHTCRSHPSGRPAWNYPLPDPLATHKTGKQRYNFMFDYSPTDTFEWPVSGMVGFKPKTDYKDYIESKLECPVCMGKKEGCKNSVAQEYGQPKPFCTEHLAESPYPKKLAKSEMLKQMTDPSKSKKQLDAEGMAERREVEAAWREQRAEHFKPGDDVTMNRQGKPGTGKLVGKVLEIDTEMEDRTHRVQWVNPKSVHATYAWVDPKDLDSSY